MGGASTLCVILVVSIFFVCSTVSISAEPAVVAAPPLWGVPGHDPQNTGFTSSTYVSSSKNKSLPATEFHQHGTYNFLPLTSSIIDPRGYVYILGVSDSDPQSHPSLFCFEPISGAFVWNQTIKPEIGYTTGSQYRIALDDEGFVYIALWPESSQGFVHLLQLNEQPLDLPTELGWNWIGSGVGHVEDMLPLQEIDGIIVSYSGGFRNITVFHNLTQGNGSVEVWDSGVNGNTLAIYKVNNSTDVLVYTYVNNTVYCIDLEQRKVIWTYEAFGRVINSNIIVDQIGSLYWNDYRYSGQGLFDFRMNKLNSDGKLIWDVTLYIGNITNVGLSLDVNRSRAISKSIRATPNAPIVIQSVDMDSGSEMWTVERNDDFDGKIVIDEAGSYYVGSSVMTGILVLTWTNGSVVYVDYGDSVTAEGIDAGKLSQLAIGNQTLYLTTSSGLALYVGGEDESMDKVNWVTVFVVGGVAAGVVGLLVVVITEIISAFRGRGRNHAGYEMVVSS